MSDTVREPHGEWFTFAELTRSVTAERHGIDNVPTEEDILGNLQDLADVLDSIRDAWGAPIVVTSGYRCAAVNALVGGVPTSAHALGLAADIRPKSVGRMRDFWLWLAHDWACDTAFDQLIGEQMVGDRPSWIHLGIRNAEGLQRRQVFTT